jgi:peroxin-1
MSLQRPGKRTHGYVLLSCHQFTLHSRPDLIDSALLRPGRLDKSVLCDMPSLEERADVSQNLLAYTCFVLALTQPQIFRALSHKVKLSDKVDLEALAEQTEGYSGADLQALLYNAHLDVVHETITASEATGVNIRSRGSKTEGRVEYVVLGAKSTKTVRSKAEENALEARVWLTYVH